MKHLLLTLTILLLVGCGGGSKPSDDQQQEVIPPYKNNIHVIYDNDHFDPDWVIGLDTVIELHNNGTISVDAIVLTGTDIYQKAGMKYNSILIQYIISKSNPAYMTINNLQQF